MSDGISRGTDLLADSLSYGPRRKIVLESYGPSGIDVKGLVRVGDIPVDGEISGEDKIVHMNGSIVAFPDACFLWNVTSSDEVTLESLAVVRLLDLVVRMLSKISREPNIEPGQPPPSLLELPGEPRRRRPAARRSGRPGQPRRGLRKLCRCTIGLPVGALGQQRLHELRRLLDSRCIATDAHQAVVLSNVELRAALLLQLPDLLAAAPDDQWDLA